MKKTLFILLGAVAFNASAAGLLKQLPKAPDMFAASEVLPLNRMTQPSLERLHNYKQNWGSAEFDHRFKVGENQMGYMTSHDRGRTGEVQTLLIDPDGTAYRQAFQISPTEAAPLNTVVQAVVGWEHRTQVIRRFSIPGGERKISQDYQLYAGLEGATPLRITTLFKTEIPGMTGTVKYELVGPEVTLIGRNGTYKSNFDFPEFTKGEIVDFSLNSSGSQFTVYTIKKDQVTEFQYALSLRESNMSIQAKKTSERKLTAAEARQLGLKAEFSAVSGRQAADKPAGNMKVGTEATK
jgi:hypothetical protein